MDSYLKKTRSRKKYIDEYRDNIKELLDDEYRIFDYIDHLYDTQVGE